MRSLLTGISLWLVLVATSTSAAPAAPAPETLGFSAERLARFEQTLNAQLANQQLAGAVTLLARHGTVLSFNSYGQQDIASATPMAKDSIFRIYSMTKPVISVAMMILYEEGKWLPQEPISKYIPEFKNLKVYAGTAGNGQILLEAPQHEPTMLELLTHTAGFSSGFFNTPVDKLYAPQKLFESGSLQEFIAKLAQLPLAYQPGQAWEYGASADIQGYLIERLSGMSLPEFLQQRIFTPLAMKDTAFQVPPTKLARLATGYQPDASGALSPMAHDPLVSQAPKMPSGGSGLYSTAEDYYHFAQMLLNGGEFNHQRILAPSSVKVLRSNHLPEALRTGKYGVGSYRMQPGFGFGYNLGVVDDPVKLGSATGDGTFLWLGIGGTWFWVDPANDIVFIGMTQRWLAAPNTPSFEELSRVLIHQALLAPQK